MNSLPGQRCCRGCGAPLQHSFCDLGMSPLSNGFLPPGRLSAPEVFLPLHAWVCGQCFLVQLEAFESPAAIFNDEYAYFSSYSQSWLEHARAYAGLMQARFGIGAQSQVVEVASNDGYLLQYFRADGVPVLGIEPAGNVAAVAEAKGIRTLTRFFGRALADELVAQGMRADLLLGNNVLAHVPDINDFVAGLQRLLADDGVVTMEFPHLLRLMQDNQFDTIYHEHYSYLSLLGVERIFERHGLVLFDVESLPTHGGSLRIYAQHAGRGPHALTPAVAALRAQERAGGLYELDTYARFEARVHETKRALLEFLIGARRDGRSVVAYGAAAKGNTLLNYCGIRSDFIDYVVDRSLHKQGRFLPGTHLPVHAPERIFETRPDYVLILPWNLRDEIAQQMAGIRDWGGRFVVPIPRVEVLG